MSRKAPRYVVCVQFETEDGRTLEVSSRPMGPRAAQKLAARYNVCCDREHRPWGSFRPVEPIAHVNMYLGTNARKVREVE